MSTALIVPKPRRASIVLAVVFVTGAVATATSWAQVPTEPITGAAVTCTDGQAAGFGCEGIDLLSFLPIAEITGPGVAQKRARWLSARHECHDEECHSAAPGVVELNDIWGWTDPETGKEYALVGRSEGTAFVDVSDPVNPVYLGELLSHADTSVWRDVKTFGNHAFIVADYNQLDTTYVGDHGLQIFDLTQLRDVTNPPVVFSETAHYSGFGNAHNIFINEETGYAYAVGTETFGGGLHIIDVSNPVQPTFAGSFSDLTTGYRSTGYSHDVQCVVYRGPDERYEGREICIGSNETAISIADVTDKSAPVAVSTGSYATRAYVHQGWLTEDHRFFLQDDELDEGTYVQQTRTIIWDLTDLEQPQVLAEYFGPTQAIDHNQYVVGHYAFQANYKSGLRILDISDVALAGEDATAIREVAYFDTYPAADNRGFEGAWSNYPFFESGIVVVSSISEGLFVLKPTSLAVSNERPELPRGFDLSPAYPNPFNPATTLELTLAGPQEVVVAAFDVLGREVARLHEGPLAAGVHRLTFDAAGLPSGPYLVRATGTVETRTQVITLLK